MESAESIILANLILPIIKEIVTPKVQAVIRKYTFPKINEEKICISIDNYLTQRYEKYSIIDTLVFPNKQTLLKTIYEPLTITTETIEREIVKDTINSFPEELFEEYYRILIEDTAGMGKSTIIKKIFLSIIEEKKGIPILIELRQLNKKNNILTEIQNQLSPIGEKIDKEFILYLIKEGEFIFLLDGFDEISLVDREFVLRELHSFVEKANNNYFLLSSRPEDTLTSFGDFQKFYIQPLSIFEAYSLIKRYDSYNAKPIADILIKELQQNYQSTLEEYLSNPFLVSLLYKSFEYKKDIPIKRSQFYCQVFDSLFETHDLSKEGYLKRKKYSNLHIDDFERVLRYLGYFTAIENKVEYDKNYIINTIGKLKNYIGDLYFNPADFLKDLLETVPLFKKDGNYIKWSHKSLQDYFAAKFIWIDSKENQEKILKKIFNDSENRRFYNILDIFCELDPKSFDLTILYWLLIDFKNYARMFKNIFEKISDDLIIQRIENNYHKKCTIIVIKRSDFKEGTKLLKELELLINHSFEYAPEFYFRNNSSSHVILTITEVEKNKNTILELISVRRKKLSQKKSHTSPLDIDNPFKLYIPYYVSMNNTDYINDENIFELTNVLISFDFTINYNNALSKLNELEKEKDKNIESDLLNW